MQTIFTQPQDRSAFAMNGFMRKQLLNAQQVEAIAQLYAQHFPGGTDKFFSSTFLEDVQLKQTISRQLCELLLPHIGPYIENYKLLGAQFLVKNPGNEGTMPFHQDWTIVDEQAARSLTVWIGLSDITLQNGAIRVIPGSHEFSRNLRGPGNFDALSNVQQQLADSAHTLTMKAGEAFIFDHSLIHGSGANTTGSPRIAVGLGLTHKDAPLRFYHKKNENSFDAYSVADNFFITFPNNGQPPAGLTPVNSIPQSFEKVLPDDLIKKMKELSMNDPIKLSVQPLFKDRALQAAFDKDGFVKIKLLEENEVNDLKAYYLSLQHNHIGEYGFHISLENEDAGYVNGVFKKLFATALPKLDSLLDNYKAFTASYVIKEAGLQNIVPPHQDWTFVDEDHFTSATVWIPLMDVNKNNGGLGVIKGSHRVFNYPRASPSPQSKSLLSDHAFTLFPFVEVIDMKAGEALIFNNRTVHASPPNISGVTRIAAGIGITQKDAQLLHYYQEPGPEENIHVYAVDASFFTKYNNSKLSAHYANNETPQGLQKINTFRKAAPVLSKAEVTQMISTIDGVTHNPALMAELAELYNYNSDGTPKTNTSMNNNGNSQNIKPTTDTVKTTVQAADTRTFFQKYTIPNILAEIKYRFKKA